MFIKFLNCNPYIVILIIFFLVFILNKILYRKASYDMLIIRKGFGKTKIIHNESFFVFPFFHKIIKLPLDDIEINMEFIDEFITKDFIKINMNLNANISIPKYIQNLQIFAKNFMGYKKEDIYINVREIIKKNIEKIIDLWTAKEIIDSERQFFLEMLVKNLSSNLKDVGLKLSFLNIQDVSEVNKKMKEEQTLEQRIDNISVLIEKITNLKDENNYSIIQEEKELFEEIVKILCELYKNEELQDEILDLSEYLEDRDICACFGWIMKKNRDTDDIDFSYYKKSSNDSITVFDAEIDLTYGNSAPYKVLRYEGNILELVNLINELSPVLGYILFDIK